MKHYVSLNGKPVEEDRDYRWDHRKNAPVFYRPLLAYDEVQVTDPDGRPRLIPPERDRPALAITVTEPLTKVAAALERIALALEEQNRQRAK